MGKPGFSNPFTRCQPLSRLPPEHCAPHSMMCPATVPAAIRSQSSERHPNSCTSGPRVRPVSVTRPVTTTLAPPRSASTIGAMPRYALAERTRSRTSASGRPVSRSRSA